MAKTTPWTEIKAEYLKGVPPKELAEKYKIKAERIHTKANKDGWTAEKNSIYENLRDETTEYIKKLTQKALKTLETIITDDEAEDKDRVAASRAVLDVSGLKSSKQEITGKDGAPLAVQKEYILPEEVKEFEEHYKKITGEI